MHGKVTGVTGEKVVIPAVICWSSSTTEITKGITMSVNFDSHVITFSCPKCSQELNETIGRLKHNPKIPCPGCGVTINVDADELRGGVETAQKSIDDFKRVLGNFGK